LVRLVSIAPENEGAEEFVKVVKNSVKVGAGHTDADYETMVKAIDWGVTQLTHTYNAMRGLHHRNPGAIGAAIDDGRVFCELISDGMHVHPAMVRTLYKAVGAERLVLISDSVRPAYLPDGEYDSCGLKVFVKNGKATLEDGTIAGSSSTLFDCMKKAVEFGLPVEDAVRAATYNPAKAVGIDNEYGVIKTGRAADFILVDKELNLKAVYIDGKKIK
jgi:N-acetylglucosamine-6-phosphate deacetylase